eukprot:scaffold11431_cov118-Isochrysis_galbana.AAC.15
MTAGSANGQPTTRPRAGPDNTPNGPKHRVVKPNRARCSPPADATPAVPRAAAANLGIIRLIHRPVVPPALPEAPARLLHGAPFFNQLLQRASEQALLQDARRTRSALAGLPAGRALRRRALGTARRADVACGPAAVACERSGWSCTASVMGARTTHGLRSRGCGVADQLTSHRRIVKKRKAPRKLTRHAPMRHDVQHRGNGCERGCDGHEELGRDCDERTQDTAEQGGLWGPGARGIGPPLPLSGGACLGFSG